MRVKRKHVTASPEIPFFEMFYLEFKYDVLKDLLLLLLFYLMNSYDRKNSDTFWHFKFYSPVNDEGDVF
jgi:hypothetical protein